MSKYRNPDQDTFDRFQSPDRGRFGDNESHGGRKQITGKSDLVDVALIRFAETAKAVLAGETLDKSKAKWLPKSQVEIANDGRENFITVTMPQWLARDKGFT